jgi:hypothetical protein
MISQQEILRIANLSGFDVYPEDKEIWFNKEYDLTENMNMFVDLLEKSIKPSDNFFAHRVTKAANEIADQFKIGFCDDQMVEGFATIIRKHFAGI